MASWLDLTCFYWEREGNASAATRLSARFFSRLLASWRDTCQYLLYLALHDWRYSCASSHRDRVTCPAVDGPSRTHQPQRPAVCIRKGRDCTRLKREKKGDICMHARPDRKVGSPAGSPHSHLLNTTTPAVSLSMQSFQSRLQNTRNTMRLRTRKTQSQIRGVALPICVASW